MVTRYIPMDVGITFRCTGAELYDLRHSYFSRGEDGSSPLTACFSLPDQEPAFLTISFSHVDIVRVLDEVFLSTEEHGEEIFGVVPYHFAYRVENSRFWNSQSEFYREIRPEAVHYRFVTGGACLDVVTTVEPAFERNYLRRLVQPAWNKDNNKINT